MRVGIVGAGIAGLAAARALRDTGVASVVFEAEALVGGRIATCTLGRYVFDTGATTIAPRGRALEDAMLRELDDSELVRIELPVYEHALLRVIPGDPIKNRTERYAYVPGNRRLAELLAARLDVRLNTRVELAERLNGTIFRLEGEEFDALILTQPAPESAALLNQIGESRFLANTRYRSCLSVQMGFAAELTDHRYHALLDPEQRHPLTWLSIESAKCPNRAPEGHTALVAQLGPEYSRIHFDSPDEEVLQDTLDYIERLFGSDFGSPAVWSVVRWRHSHPETTSLFETANHAGSRVIVAGDGVVGARVEYAYESGVRAAKMLVGLESDGAFREPAARPKDNGGRQA